MTTPSQIYSDPKVFEMLVSESWPLEYEVTLQEGDSITEATSTLYDLNDNVAIDISPPTITDNFITQTADGSLLTALHGYRLEITFTTGLTTKAQTVVTLINVTVPSP